MIFELVQLTCLKNAWNGFNGNFTNTIFETREAWVHLKFSVLSQEFDNVSEMFAVHLADLLLFPLHQLLEDLLLLPHHCRELDINNPRVEFASHESCSLVVLDIPAINCLGQLQILAKSLLLEIAHE